MTQFNSTLSNDALKFTQDLNGAPPAPDYEYYNSLTNREIWIDDDISEETDTLSITKKIIQWNREDHGKPKHERQPIILYIFSCGGDSDICRSIIDTIKCSSTPVYGINMGRCISAAAYIFIACHKRFMLKHSYCLFHQGSAYFSGDYDKLSAWVDDYKSSVAELSEIMLEFTNYSKEEIETRIVSEWYVHSEEAVEKGVCDTIITNLDMFITKT